jgi:hypothetical protein
VADNVARLFLVDGHAALAVDAVKLEKDVGLLFTTAINR